MHFYSCNLDEIGVVETSLDDLTNKDCYDWANYPLELYGHSPKKATNLIPDLTW